MNVNWVIAVFTLVAAFAAVMTWNVYASMHRTTKIMERCYVTMSHEPPGVNFIPDRDKPTAIQATVRIENTGHSPADILEMRWIAALNEAQIEAERDRQAPSASAPLVKTLLPGESFGYWQHLEAEFTPDLLRQVAAGTKPLWLVGSVTYLDRFERKRHRNWYGRKFIHPTLPGKENNNLAFMLGDPRYHVFHLEQDLDEPKQQAL